MISLYQIHTHKLFFLLAVFFIALSIFAVIIVRRYLPLHFRYRDNGVVGIVSNVIGIIYGVLVGLTALYLFNNTTNASNAVIHEANAAGNLFRDSTWLPDPFRTNIQNEIKTYLNNVLTVEWPLMQQGKDFDGLNIDLINQIHGELYAYMQTAKVNSVLVEDMLEEIRNLNDARRERVFISDSELSPDIWLVILIGTALTIGINFLYRLDFKLHLVIVGAAGLMAGSMVFLLVAIDRPYQGDFVLAPNAIKALIKFIETHKSVAQVSFREERRPGEPHKNGKPEKNKSG